MRFALIYKLLKSFIFNHVGSPTSLIHSNKT